jgi:DivIVA domain-containing protein
MVLLTVAVVAGVVALVSGVVSGGLSEPEHQVPARALPVGPLTGRDVTELRFVQALRGYRMDQVDAAMDALGAEIDRLRALVPEDQRLAPPTEEEIPAHDEPAEEVAAWRTDWAPESGRAER